MYGATAKEIRSTGSIEIETELSRRERGQINDVSKRTYMTIFVDFGVKRNLHKTKCHRLERQRRDITRRLGLY